MTDEPQAKIERNLGIKRIILLKVLGFVILFLPIASILIHKRYSQYQSRTTIFNEGQGQIVYTAVGEALLDAVRDKHRCSKGSTARPFLRVFWFCSPFAVGLLPCATVARAPYFSFYNPFPGRPTSKDHSPL